MLWIILVGVIVYIVIGTAWSYIYYSRLDSDSSTDKFVNAWFNIFFWPIAIVCVASFLKNEISKEEAENG